MTWKREGTARQSRRDRGSARTARFQPLLLHLGRWGSVRRRRSRHEAWACNSDRGRNIWSRSAWASGSRLEDFELVVTVVLGDSGALISQLHVADIDSFFSQFGSSVGEKHPAKARGPPKISIGADSNCATRVDETLGRLPLHPNAAWIGTTATPTAAQSGPAPRSDDDDGKTAPGSTSAEAVVGSPCLVHKLPLATHPSYTVWHGGRGDNGIAAASAYVAPITPSSRPLPDERMHAQ